MIEAGKTVGAMASDVSMPGIHGVTTIRKLRSLPEAALLPVTGHVRERAVLSSENAFFGASLRPMSRWRKLRPAWLAWRVRAGSFHTKAIMV